jgi:hypothetical protein
MISYISIIHCFFCISTLKKYDHYCHNICLFVNYSFFFRYRMYMFMRERELLLVSFYNNRYWFLSINTIDTRWIVCLCLSGISRSLYLFLNIYTRVPNVLKREEKWQWRNNKIFCCSHRILEKAQRERCRQEKYIERKKGGDFTLLFFSLPFVRKNWFPTATITLTYTHTPLCKRFIFRQHTSHG